MPEEVVPEVLKLNRGDTTDNALNSSGVTEVRIMPTCRIRRTNNYNEDDSDSNSEDESPFSPESNESAISRFEDSQNLETTGVPTLLQLMSIGSDTSADSVDSILPGGRDCGAWIRSSSESSPYSSTSHSHSDSEDESSEAEERSSDYKDMIKKLKEMSRNHDENYEARSKNNNNDEEDESSSTRNIPVSSKNEESDVSASDNDSGDDSTNEDEVKVIPRGPYEKLHPRSSNKPYNRPSPKYENGTEAFTPDDGSSYNLNTPPSAQYEESDHTSDDNSNDNYSKSADEAAVRSWGPIQSPHNGEIMRMLEDTTETDIRNECAICLPSYCGESECRAEDLVATLILQSSEEQLEVLDSELLPNSRYSPTEETPIFDAIGYGDNNNTNSQPEILINGAFPNQSPENTFSRTVSPPMSSASSSNSFGINEQSPVSYTTDIDPAFGESMTPDIGGINIHEVLGTPCETRQDRSPSHLLYPVILNDVGNQTNVYTQSPDLVVSRQGNVNICQSDVCNNFNIQTGIQAQTSPSQITGDSYFFSPTQPTQYQPNDLQQQLPTTQRYEPVISPNGNSLSTSWGFVKVTSTDKVESQLTPIGQDQTNNTVKCNEGQTRKPIPKTNPKKSITPTASAPITSTSRDGSHLPATVEKINNKSSYQKKGRAPIDGWSLSRLPSTLAVEKLKQKVSKIDAYLAMRNLYTRTDDYYTEKDGMGDTQLMTIVRDSNKLPSQFALIMAMLNKMKMIPESLTMTNKDGHDALYLAAINCPEYSFVAGVIAATIEKSCKSNDIWQRNYNHGGTLLHELAARGDSHVDVLQELLTVQRTSNRTLFNLSAKNFNGETPLHVAVKVHDRMGSVKVIMELMDYGASPIITDEKNGDTPLHMAVLNRSCLEIVQALLRKDGNKAVNMLNNIGNTPLHLAAEFLNNVDPMIQAGVWGQLIAAGGRTNIRNQQNDVPYAYMKEKRREMIAGIFCKRIVKN